MYLTFKSLNCTNILICMYDIFAQYIFIPTFNKTTWNENIHFYCTSVLITFQYYNNVYDQGRKQ